MIIEENILIQNGGEFLEYENGDIIFNRDCKAKYYWQIVSGTVKMDALNGQGKEFLYGLPYRGHSIAESYLFNDKKYPFNATAISRCKIIRLEKARFLNLMEIMPHLLIDISVYVSQRVHFKNLMLPALGVTSSEERLTILLNYIKEFYGSKEHTPFVIPYTRQQLASLTGMSVETTIRTVKKMEKNSLLKVCQGKIVY